MPATSTKKLPDEPIVIHTVSGDVSAMGDKEKHYKELLSTLNAVTEPVFFIMDLSDAQVNFDELLLGVTNAYRGDNPLLKRESIRQLVVITKNPVLELAADGMDSRIFGNIKIKQFKTLEEALTYARAAK